MAGFRRNDRSHQGDIHHDDLPRVASLAALVDLGRILEELEQRDPRKCRLCELPIEAVKHYLDPVRLQNSQTAVSLTAARMLAGPMSLAGIVLTAAIGCVSLNCAAQVIKTQNPAVLRSNDVRVELMAGGDVPKPVGFSSPAGAAWRNDEAETLPGSGEVNGAMVPITWLLKPERTRRSIVLLWRAWMPESPTGCILKTAALRMRWPRAAI